MHTARPDARSRARLVKMAHLGPRPSLPQYPNSGCSGSIGSKSGNVSRINDVTKINSSISAVAPVFPTATPLHLKRTSSSHCICHSTQPMLAVPCKWSNGSLPSNSGSVLHRRLSGVLHDRTYQNALACISHRRIVDLGELGSGNSWKGRLFCVITTLSKRGSGCGKGGLSYDRV